MSNENEAVVICEFTRSTIDENGEAKTETTGQIRAEKTKDGEDRIVIERSKR